MLYAIVDSMGVCTNIIEADSGFAASIAAIKADEDTHIGDIFLNGSWIKNRSPEETPGPPQNPQSFELLQSENKLLKAQLRAQTERSDFIEDCIAEMATVVYGGV